MTTAATAMVHEMPLQKKVLDPAKRSDQVAHFHEALSRLVVGQNEAIEQIASMYQMLCCGLNAPGRTLGNYLFLGPTGTGKTRTVEATAEALIGDPKAVIKIDCAEFQHSHEICKLIGSPPGYLGHRETAAALSQAKIDQHQTESCKISLLLFDEIEKASDALWNLLLGILDKATLTLGDNQKVDFSKCMIFLTSNLGAKEMSSLLAPGIGFGNVKTHSVKAIDQTRIERTAVGAAKRNFTPEFMNRIDKCVVFRPLGNPELRRILDLELAKIQQRLLESNNGAFVVTLTAKAKDHILSQSTADPRYGARQLKRVLEQLLVNPLSSIIDSGQISSGDLVEADAPVTGESLTFHAQSGIAMDRLAQLSRENVGLAA